MGGQITLYPCVHRNLRVQSRLLIRVSFTDPDQAIAGQRGSLQSIRWKKQLTTIFSQDGGSCICHQQLDLTIPVGGSFFFVSLVTN